jgi:leader peptidase (prepilin peptidase)/N-methyltransferase
MNCLENLTASIGVNTSLVGAIIFVVGLVFGSFATVLATRIPENQSLRGRSNCLSCGAIIPFYLNIPLLGYLYLRGRCANCKTKISLTYPLTELTMALAFLVTAISTVNYFQFILWTIFLIITLPLAVIDWKFQRLPNSLTFALFIFGFIILGLQAIVEHKIHFLAIALLSSAALTLFYFLTMILSRGGMGFGDVKLAASIGLYTGFISATTTFVASLTAFFIGSFYGVAMMLTGKANRKTGIPFGQFMIVGALASQFVTILIANFLKIS